MQGTKPPRLVSLHSLYCNRNGGLISSRRQVLHGNYVGLSGGRLGPVRGPSACRDGHNPCFFCEGPPPGPLRRRVPPITVGPHPGSQYLAPALALGSPVLAPQGHPTSGYLVKSPLTIYFASVRVRSCELRRYNHPRHTLTTN